MLINQPRIIETEDMQVVADAQLLAGSLGQLPDPEAEPSLIVVSGLPGTGKSYFCSKLAERLQGK